MSPSSTAEPLISAFVICCNEERNIRRCLASVSWCDEILVVDSGSTDRTVTICREFGVRLFQRPWPGFVAQKRFALEQCKGTWVLNLDADEEVSPELRDEIIAQIRSLEATNSEINGFEISRVVFYLGRWWRRGGWYPEYRLRLCRRSHTSWGGDDPHERAIVSGKIQRLGGELRHYTYTSIANQIASHNNFSSTAAKTMQAKGRRASLASLIGNPIARFIKFYLIKRGFLEGLPGLVVAVLESYYVFLKYVKLYELELWGSSDPRTAESEKRD